MELKVGDRVFIVRHSLNGDGRSYESIAKVISISPKRGDLKVEGYETIFNTSGHSKEKGIWSHGAHLELATEELIEKVKKKVKRNKNINRIQNFDVKNASDEMLEIVANAIRSVLTKE